MEGNILAIQSYGYINGPHDKSTGAIGSRLRINAALRFIAEGTIPRNNLTAVFPQGRDPKKLEPEDAMPLGKSLEVYLSSKPEAQAMAILSKPMGWSTFEDIQNTYRMIRELGHETAHIYFVSDPVHIKRMKLVWKHTRPRGWKATFLAAADHHMSWFKCNVREPVAYLWYWYRFMKQKYAKLF